MTERTKLGLGVLEASLLLGLLGDVLLLNESSLPTRFIIGHENSLLHRRTKFRIEPRAENASRPAG